MSNKVIVNGVDMIELIERDKPMKLKYHNNGRGYCAVCGKSKQYDSRGNENTFCGGCGQRILWGKENE